jgi:adenylate cyclase
MEAVQSIRDEYVADALNRVLSSKDFDASDRNRDFLKFVVEETLSGRENLIKAYTIATTVFGRPADFDPSQDSIVRIEAGRLRRSLERYYLTGGAGDLVRIIVPKGTYVPVFQETETQRTISAPLPAPRARSNLKIVVAAFDEEGDSSDYPGFAQGFVRHLVVGLTRFTEIDVFGPELSNSFSNSNSDTSGQGSDPDFILFGVVSHFSGRIVIETFLKEAHTGQILWAEIYDRTECRENLLGLRDLIADEVVRTIAQPYGILFLWKSRNVESQSRERLDVQECITRFYQYWRQFEPALHKQVRESLETATELNPHHAEAWACLSLVLVNEYRHELSGSADQRVLLRALKLANRAVELSPNSSHGYFSLGIAYWHLGDLVSCFHALETGLGLNPNDTVIMGKLGLYHALRMNWDRAVPLITESYSRNPAQLSTYRLGLALNHYYKGNLPEALAEVRKISHPEKLGKCLLWIALNGTLQPRAGKDNVSRNLDGSAVSYSNELARDLKKFNVHPEIIDRLAADLKNLERSGERPAIA